MNKGKAQSAWGKKHERKGSRDRARLPFHPSVAGCCGGRALDKLRRARERS